MLWGTLCHRSQKHLIKLQKAYNYDPHCAMEECFSQVCDLSVRPPRMADKGRCRQPLMILQSFRPKAVFSSFWWKLKLTVTMFRLLKWGSNCTTAKEKTFEKFWNVIFFKPYLQDLIKANRDDQADVKPSHSQTNFLSIFFFLNYCLDSEDCRNVLK